MVSHLELCTDWINGVENRKGSRMFIEDKIIFSYGHHFPIAMKISYGQYLFNTDKYSSSTSKHQSYVRRAIRGEIIECTTEEIKRAICSEGKVVVIKQIEKISSFDEAMLVLKRVCKERGMKRFSIEKVKKMLEADLICQNI